MQIVHDKYFPESTEQVVPNRPLNQQNPNPFAPLPAWLSGHNPSEERDTRNPASHHFERHERNTDKREHSSAPQPRSGSPRRSTTSAYTSPRDIPSCAPYKPHSAVFNARRVESKPQDVPSSLTFRSTPYCQQMQLVPPFATVKVKQEPLAIKTETDAVKRLFDGL